MSTKPRLLQAITRDRKLTPIQVRVGIALIGYRNQKTGLIFPSQALLAAELNVHVRTIVRAIKALMERGWLNKRRGPQMSANRYSFNLDLIRIVELDYETMKATRRSIQGVAEVKVAPPKTELSSRNEPLMSHPKVTPVSDEPLERTYRDKPIGLGGAVRGTPPANKSPARPMILVKADGFHVVDPDGSSKGVFRSEREAQREVSRIFPEGEVWEPTAFQSEVR